MEIATHVDCKVTIILSDKREIILTPDSLGGNHDVNNYITNLSINEEMATNNTNPVGVISANTVSLSINSIDRSMIPENKGSVYFGYMNRDAVIKIEVTEKGEVIPFGIFFVNRWASTINSSNPHKVTIEAADILSTVNKNEVPLVNIRKNVSIKDYIIETVTLLNKKLGVKYSVILDQNNINFGKFPIMQYNNIDADNMGRMLNIVSQSTLTNMYITRENKLQTDYCCDDTIRDSVGTLSDKTNILSASVDSSNNATYSGVKVHYSNSVINNVSELATLRNQKLLVGDTTFENISLGGKAFKVSFVAVSTKSDKDVFVKGVAYTKNIASITIENKNSDELDCDIVIYGQSMNDNKLFVERYLKNSDQTVLEVNNTLLEKQYVEKYADELLRLITLRDSALQLNGWFSPKMKLGDIVYVDVEKSINTKGYYKVTGLNWNISSTIRCNAKLIKHVEQGGV